MNREANKNIIKTVVILLIIILIFILAIIVIIQNNPIQKNLKYIYNDMQAEMTVMPTNVGTAFYKYSGELKLNSIYKSLEIFGNKTVEKYMLSTRSLDDTSIDKFFNDNKREIEKELRVTSVEEFKEIANELKKLKGDSLKLKSWTINPETVAEKENSLEFVMIMNYENNTKVAFRMNILSKIEKNKTPIKFTAGVEEKYIDYEYLPPESVNYYTDDSGPVGRVL